MGIDLYVGTMTRYFTRRWLTAQQQWAQSMGGVPAKVVAAPGAFPMQGLSYGEGHRIVQHWRVELGRALRKSGIELGAWKEDVEQPYASVQLVWEGYGALMLWAAYQEAPNLMPREIRPAEWAKDPAFQKVLDSSSRFAPLCQVYAWLPLSLPTPAYMPMPDGKQRVFSSLEGIDRALRELNDMTWCVTAASREVWLKEAAECTSFEALARATYDRFRQQVSFAVANNLPMVMDW